MSTQFLALSSCTFVLPFEQLVGLCLVSLKSTCQICFAFYILGTTQFLCTGVVAVLPTLVLFSMVINDLAKQITVTLMFHVKVLGQLQMAKEHRRVNE